MASAHLFHLLRLEAKVSVSFSAIFDGIEVRLYRGAKLHVRILGLAFRGKNDTIYSVAEFVSQGQAVSFGEFLGSPTAFIVMSHGSKLPSFGLLRRCPNGTPH
jgi:hypothetical protein